MTDDAMVEVTQAQFWSKVDRRGPDDCWLWQGGKASTGYGRAYIARRGRPAHQVAWEIKNGEPFPAGRVACHSCDNPLCVNPDHIWAGTQGDNIRDCVSKGRHGSRPSTHCQRGHRMDAANRAPTTGGFRCRACERENGRLRTQRYRQRRREANG